MIALLTKNVLENVLNVIDNCFYILSLRAQIVILNE